MFRRTYRNDNPHSCSRSVTSVAREHVQSPPSRRPPPTACHNTVEQRRLSLDVPDAGSRLTLERAALEFDHVCERTRHASGHSTRRDKGYSPSLRARTRNERKCVHACERPPPAPSAPAEISGSVCMRANPSPSPLLSGGLGAGNIMSALKVRPAC